MNEKPAWRTPSVDLMSEEEDVVLDGKPMWVEVISTVRGPARESAG